MTTPPSPTHQPKPEPTNDPHTRLHTSLPAGRPSALPSEHTSNQAPTSPAPLTDAGRTNAERADARRADATSAQTTDAVPADASKHHAEMFSPAAPLSTLPEALPTSLETSSPTGVPDGGVSYLLIGGLGVQPVDWEALLSFMPGAHIVIAERAAFTFPHAPLAQWDAEIEHLSRILVHMPGKVVVVGHSLGALLAESLVRLHPEKACSLVFVDGSNPRRKQGKATPSHGVTASGEVRPLDSQGFFVIPGEGLPVVDPHPRRMSQALQRWQRRKNPTPAATAASAGAVGHGASFGELNDTEDTTPGRVRTARWRQSRTAPLHHLPAPFGAALMRMVGRARGLGSEQAEALGNSYRTQRGWWQLVAELAAEKTWTANLNKLAETHPLQVPTHTIIALGDPRWIHVITRSWARRQKALVKTFPAHTQEGHPLEHRVVELTEANHMVMLSTPRALRDVLLTAGSRCAHNNPRQ